MKEKIIAVTVWIGVVGIAAGMVFGLAMMLTGMVQIVSQSRADALPPITLPIPEEPTSKPIVQVQPISRLEVDAEETIPTSRGVLSARCPAGFCPVNPLAAEAVAPMTTTHVKRRGLIGRLIQKRRARRGR